MNTLSEIFPIQVQPAKYWKFQITPEVDRSAGNRISWQLNQKYPQLIIIFEGSNKVFWTLQKPNQDNFPSQQSFQESLEQIVQDLSSDLGDTTRKIIDFEQTDEVSPQIISQMAVQILNLSRALPSEEIYSRNKVKVETTVDYWSETFEFQEKTHPAIAVHVKTQIVYRGSLQDFLDNQSKYIDMEKLLLGLQVKPMGSNGTATIKQVVGTISERRQELFAKASSSLIKAKIQSAKNTDLIVSVSFGNNNALYDYSLNSLIPMVTADTASQFDVEYGEILKRTRLSYAKRQELTITTISSIQEIYRDFSFSLSKSLNSKSHSDLFDSDTINIDDVQLLFSNGFTQVRAKTLNGLRKGGIYKFHPNFSQSKTIRICIVKPQGLTVKPLYESIKQEMKRYGFSFIESREALLVYNSVNLSSSPIESELERVIDEIEELPIDFVLFFLPGSQAEDKGDVLYESAKKYLYRLNQDIAIQVIYAETIKKIYTDAKNMFCDNDEKIQKEIIKKMQNITNNVAPGMLAKLGNIPYVLNEPLKIADMFVGLDVSRFRNIKGNGSRNVCASVRLYGKQGEFQGYRFHEAFIEGEEIPQKALESFFPIKDFSQKRVLIYRDGRFRGEEVDVLIKRASQISSEFILVESVKSQVPRLYTTESGNLLPPSKGLALKLSNREVILVMTNVPEKIGVSRPLRLRIHEAGTQASLDDLIDATLKFTLLHYGSLKDPRLPIPLYSPDAIAYRRLQGTAPRYDDGDRQFWL